MIENTGTAILKNILVDDSTGYGANDFELVRGTLVAQVNTLAPGQVFEFNYSLSPESMGAMVLRPCKVTFTYIYSQQYYSQSIVVHVVSVPLIASIGVIIGVLAIVIFVRHRKIIKKQSNLPIPRTAL